MPIEKYSYLIVAVAVACGDGSPSVAPSQAGDAGGATPIGEDAASTAWPPQACDGLASPFVSDTCLAQIRDVCRSHDSESACVGQGRAGIGYLEEVGEYGFNVFCGWVPVVTFTDSSSCAVQSTSHRCEAHLERGLLACNDPCEGSPELHWAWKAIPSERELVKICGIPLGPWAVSGASTQYVSACLDGVTPPAPELCNCAQPACMAAGASPMD